MVKLRETPIETAILTRVNIPALAAKTGRSEDDLWNQFRLAQAQNKVVVIMVTSLRDIYEEREPDVPQGNSQHVLHVSEASSPDSSVS